MALLPLQASSMVQSCLSIEIEWIHVVQMLMNLVENDQEDQTSSRPEPGPRMKS